MRALTLDWSCLRRQREVPCSSCHFIHPCCAPSVFVFVKCGGLCWLLIANESDFTRWFYSYLTISLGTLLTKLIISKQFHMDSLFPILMSSKESVWASSAVKILFFLFSRKTSLKWYFKKEWVKGRQWDLWISLAALLLSLALSFIFSGYVHSYCSKPRVIELWEEVKLWLWAEIVLRLLMWVLSFFIYVYKVAEINWILLCNMPSEICHIIDTFSQSSNSI